MKINIEFKDGKTKEEVSVKIIVEPHPNLNDLTKALVALVQLAMIKLEPSEEEKE